jgi:predicted O-methyltransferase YrrM
MTTLTTEPLASLLDRLFEDAAKPYSSSLRSARDAGSTGYREFYALAKDDYLAVSPETGRLLYLLVRSCGARSVVEFGTSFGISTLHLAAGLRDNGGGRLISTEFEPSKVARSRENFVAGGLDDLIEVREGDALDTLASDLPDRIDLVLLDGAKHLYPPVLALLEPRLSPGALVVADNAERSPQFLERVRAADGEYVSVPFGGDVEVSMRV